jgi:hypothetical protein
MADARTHYPITKNEWTRVVNGGTKAKIQRSLIDATYYSMLFDDAGDEPVDGVLGDTAEKMFTDGNVVFLDNSTTVYLWVTCVRNNGAVVVTD